MATKKTVKEEIKEEVPVVKGGGDTPLPPIPSGIDGIEKITIRGKLATYRIKADFSDLNFMASIVDHDGNAYDVDTEMESI